MTAAASARVSDAPPAPASPPGQPAAPAVPPGLPEPSPDDLAARVAPAKRAGSPAAAPEPPARRGRPPGAKRTDNRPAGRSHKRKSPPAQGAPPVDRTPMLSGLAETVWMLAAGAPPLPGLPASVHVRIKAQAYVWRQGTPGIVTAANLAAANVPAVGRAVDSLTSGSVSWVLPAMFALTPFVAQSAALWRAPLETAQALAVQTAADWAELAEKLRGELAAGAPDGG